LPRPGEGYATTVRRPSPRRPSLERPSPERPSPEGHPRGMSAAGLPHGARWRAGLGTTNDRRSEGNVDQAKLTGISAGSMVPPLALAQLIASYPATNMNVTTIAEDIGNDGGRDPDDDYALHADDGRADDSRQQADRHLGRKRCFAVGLVIYGTGALLASLARGVGAMVLGYSLLEGVGSALMIPPVYILITGLHRPRPACQVLRRRQRGGWLGAAAGPSSVTGHQRDQLACFLRRSVPRRRHDRRADPPDRGARRTQRSTAVRPRRRRSVGRPLPRDLRHPAVDDLRVDHLARGLLCGRRRRPRWRDFPGVAFHGRRHGGRRRVRPARPVTGAGGKDPLLSHRLFRSRTSNLGLVTQNVQWLVMPGTSFVISSFIQQIRGFDAIRTGLLLTPATLGILVSSTAAGRLARGRTRAAPCGPASSRRRSAC
jgi:hypothetical protein